jgi:hypothetical protein
MATKHGRKKFGMGDLARNAIAAASPEELEMIGAAEIIIDKMGVDCILAALKPEQLRELVKKAASAKK